PALGVALDALLSEGWCADVELARHGEVFRWPEARSHLAPGDEVRLFLTKRGPWFASAGALATCFADAELRNEDVALADAARSLVTRGQRIVGVAGEARVRPWEGLLDPRRLVRDLSGRRLVPAEVAAYCLQDVPSEGAAGALARACVPKLATLLATELVTTAEGELRASVNAQGLHGDWRFDVDAFGAARLPELVEAVEWVYEPKSGAEVRHALLGRHVVQLASTRAAWSEALEALPEALRRAKSDYVFHLRGLSAERAGVLRGLQTQLRSELGVVSKEIAAVAGLLWQDLALTVGAILMLWAPSSTRLAPVLALLIMLLTVVNLVVRTWHATAQVSAARADLARWRPHLYAHIDAEEFEALVGEPVRKRTRRFRGTVATVWLAHVAFLAVVAVAVRSEQERDDGPPVVREGSESPEPAPAPRPPAEPLVPRREAPENAVADPWAGDAPPDAEPPDATPDGPAEPAPRRPPATER
ncbi:MAG: hypothetical protein AAGH15_27010, partial [Myxococcota bacterium]